MFRTLLAVAVFFCTTTAFATTERVYVVDYETDQHLAKLMEETMKTLRQYNVDCVVTVKIVPHAKYYKTEVQSLRGTSQFNSLYISNELWVQNNRTIVRTRANIDLKPNPLLELIPLVKKKKWSIKKMVENTIINRTESTLNSIKDMS